jgi:uncharacterized membrane protein (DUF2068 family)
MIAASSEGKKFGRPRQRSSELGLRLIIGYKFLKRMIELLMGASFLFLGLVGVAEKLTAIVRVIRHHATEAWSIALAERIIHASTAHNVFVVAVAIIADGTVTLLEGWALHGRYRWSRWLVVGTTFSLLPFEVVTLVRHPSAGRVTLVLTNALIVVYLIQRRAAFTTLFLSGGNHGIR